MSIQKTFHSKKTYTGFLLICLISLSLSCSKDDPKKTNADYLGNFETEAFTMKAFSMTGNLDTLLVIDQHLNFQISDENDSFQANLEDFREALWKRLFQSLFPEKTIVTQMDTYGTFPVEIANGEIDINHTDDLLHFTIGDRTYEFDCDVSVTGNMKNNELQIDFQLHGTDSAGGITLEGSTTATRQ